MEDPKAMSLEELYKHVQRENAKKTEPEKPLGAFETKYAPDKSSSESYRGRFGIGCVILMVAWTLAALGAVGTGCAKVILEIVR